MIATYGKRKLQFLLGSEHYEWPFVVAEVERPLLGADFLRYSGLLVNVRTGKLVKPDTFQAVNIASATLAHNTLNATTSTNGYEKLLQEFPHITTPTFELPDVRHGVTHHITTTGPPVHSKVRRLSPDKLKIAKAEFQHMLDLGIIRRSKSQWAAPLHMVPKSNGNWRPCADFRRLNCATRDDRYPVPHVQDFTANISGNCVFSKIDLVRGYHQIPVASSDIEKNSSYHSLWAF